MPCFGCYCTFAVVRFWWQQECLICHHIVDSLITKRQLLLAYILQINVTVTVITTRLRVNSAMPVQRMFSRKLDAQ